MYNSMPISELAKIFGKPGGLELRIVNFKGRVRAMVLGRRMILK